MEYKNVFLYSSINPIAALVALFLKLYAKDINLHHPHLPLLRHGETPT
jgi:hypothetical protein